MSERGVNPAQKGATIFLIDYINRLHNLL